MEETQLLRPLTLLLPLLLASTTLAEDAPPAPKFAPGALGDLGVDVEGLMDRSKQDADALGQSLRPQAPMNIDEMSPGLEALEEQALNNPRVRALLGIAEDGTAAGEERPGYDEARMLIFASFSMPPESLRQVMRDAERFHAQVVFRGFVRNSVFKTEEALISVFGDLAEVESFAIDPTLFTRFKVAAVPVYVVLAEPVGVCETQGCAEDALPAHDRISGNIPIGAALQIVSGARGDATEVARTLLAEDQERQSKAVKSGEDADGG